MPGVTGAVVEPGTNVVAVVCHDNSSNPNVPFPMQEMPYQKSLQFSQNQPNRTLRMYVPAAKFHGRSREEFRADPTYAGITSTSSPTYPAINRWFTVAMFPINAVDSVSMYAQVEITYYVEFYERMDQAAS